MPSKQKKSKKLREKSSSSGKIRKTDDEDITIDRESMLKQELELLTQKLEEEKSNVHNLREENERLQVEKNRMGSINQQYMGYFEKKTTLKQNNILSLSDQNQKDLQDIKEQKKEILESYGEKKAELHRILLEKGNTLAKIKKEIDDLDQFKVLQDSQSTRIKELEKEIHGIQSNHNKKKHELKTRFLTEKNKFLKESDEKISTTIKQNHKEVRKCVNEQTKEIKEENIQLRDDLTKLIKKNRSLTEHRAKLENQKEELMRAQEIAKDLRSANLTKKYSEQRAIGYK